MNPASGNSIRIIIIGAGASGILMGYRLKKAGLNNFVIYEKSDRCGGTWRDNAYPGLHCDLKSHHYCYSFAPNPDWSEEQAPGPEILAYLERQALDLGVLEHVCFSTEALAGSWDGRRWTVDFPEGESDRADILVSATGFLHKINWPEIPGLETFEGSKFHTARWDHSVDLVDKRIGLVGTGSTATQITCALAGNVASFHLFQRTAQWVLELPSHPYSDEEKAAFRAKTELMDALYKDAEEFARYVSTGLMYLDAPERSMIIKNVEDNLAKVSDPVLRAKLTPDYAVGCKRLVMSPNFYEAIQRPDTELVDDGIERVAKDGIVTTTGRLIPLDVLVLATGFDAQAYLRPMKLVGENGITLDEVWAKRPLAYKSMMVPHMPNFFMICGPYSPVANISLIKVAELQTDWIMKIIERIVSGEIAIAPTQAATDGLVEDFCEQAKKTVWYKGGCSSWYLDAEGIPAIYPYDADRFQRDMLAEAVDDDFVITNVSDSCLLNVEKDVVGR